MTQPVKTKGKTPSPFIFIVGTTSLAFVVSQLDVSIVNIALPQISRSFKADISELQWIVDAYTIAFAVLMLSAGGMSDLLGSKRLFKFGLLTFGIASVGCGLSWNPFSLIGFRVLQGIGAAAMIPSSLSILNQSFAHDPTRRSKAVAWWTAAGGVSIAAGPILGGLLLHISNWRMIFFVNIPICLAGILLSIKLKDSEKHVNKGFDIPGQFTWMLALTALIAAIIELHHLGFNNPVIYGSLIFSAIMFLLFLRIEQRAASPILPLDLFTSSTFNVLVLMGIVLNATYYGTVFVLSLYLQDVLHYSSLTAGMAFLPLTAGFIISNLISGRLMAKYGTRVPILTGLTIGSIGFAGLLIAGSGTPYWQLFIPFITIPMGMGLAVPAMTTGILSTVAKTRSGTASAVLNTSRQAAGAMGVAVFGAMANGGVTAIVHAITVSSVISAIGIFSLIFLIRKYLQTT
ncbi:MFS transporter [Mucilaginibacter pocheonensis]|uniref:DHA2 family methylenomycin A resistance protein-like MFS transporter n=1 Tax=Mucilaginibacter pocheonensis TaxID=398050 RepID=A0ABU1TG82_9SPHI|nr:MFS transporter [Mucilaginibacter pocheonensis]MDR6944406.1 DHA2 family methylenomycin A resistance protein-like MFS transporter [Mucilaginibacter pocheonensis]